MPTLHVISHSPFGDDRLHSCLRLLGDEDGVLLCGDAVYALQNGTRNCQALELMPSSIGLYALQEDVQARALQVPERVQCIDYPQFVALTLQHAKVNSWL